MSDIPTPRTDAAARQHHPQDPVVVECKNIERELAESRGELVKLREQHATTTLPECVDAMVVSDMMDENERLKLELTESQERVAQLLRSFSGHVYVRNEEYAALCAARDHLQDESNRLHDCIVALADAKEDAKEHDACADAWCAKAKRLNAELAEAKRGCVMLADNATIWKARCDKLVDACRWAQQQLGKHTRPSPLDKALADIEGV